jgi:tetratricopeptide (TPR) repeat protein
MSESLPHLLRGRLLQEQNRFEEAEAYFRQAIGADPDHSECHAELAVCLYQMDGRRKDALLAIDQAITGDPDNARHHGLRSLILTKLNRGREAVAAADRAIAIDPDESFNHAAKAEAFASQNRWADAEKAARQALTLDPDNDHATNILASLLRVQGKQGESEIAAEQLLAEGPEDPYAHYNAGWAALQAQDCKKAEEHFREALRIDADFEAARDGLLESFKARSGFYRLYLRYAFWMQRFTQGAQIALVIGVLVIFNFGKRLLASVSPLLSGLFVAAYLGFVFWVWLAGGIGSFLVLLDKSARHALKKGEKLEGLAVGGGLILALVIFVSGAILARTPVMILGGLIAASTIPAALTFTNEQPKGRALFGAIWAGMIAIGLYVFISETARGANVFDDFAHSSATLINAAIIAGVITTWIGNVPSLRIRSN